MPAKTKRALGNSAIQGVTQLITWSFSWVLLILLPRYLGDEGFGRLFLALTYGMVLGMLLNMGINKYVAKRVGVLNPVDMDDEEAARSREELEVIVGNVFSLKLVFCLVAYGLLAAVVMLLPYPALTRQAILIICIASCISNLTLTAGSVFQGLESLLAPNIALVAEKAVATVGCAALLFMGYDLIPVCFVYVAAAAVNCVISLFLLSRRVSFRLGWDVAAVKQILLGGVPFLIWIVCGEIYIRVDVLMLSFMTGEAVVGWYGAAFRIYATLLFVPHLLNTVVFPPLARMGADQNGSAAFSAATERLMNFLLFAAVPVGAGVVIVGRPLVELLYGAGPFVNSSPSLQIFGGCIVLVSINVVLGSVLIAKDKQRKWSYMAVCAAVFNPLMNLWMIPLAQNAWQNGGIGAAVATLLTELLMMAGALTLMPAGVFTTRNIVTAARAGLCAGAMIAVIMGVGFENVFLIVPVGAVVYGLLALAVRVLPPPDIYHVLHALGWEGRFVVLQRLLGIRVK